MANPDEKADLNLSDFDEANTDVETPEGDEQLTEDDADVTTDDEVKDSPETPDDEDVTDDWDEWREQYELPESIDSVDKVAEAYVESLKEMKRVQQRLNQVDQTLRAQGISNGVDGLSDGTAFRPQTAPPAGVTPPKQGESYFKENPVSEVVSSWEKKGVIAPEAIQSFRGVAQLADEAFAPQFRLAEQVMTTAMQQVLSMREQLQNMQWKSLDPKVRGSFSRKQLDDVVSRGLAPDYETAANWLAFSNGDALRTFANKAEQRGRDKAKKRWKRDKGLRAGKDNPKTDKWEYRKYQDSDGNWDNDKLAKLGPDKASKMLDDWLKKNKPR